MWIRLTQWTASTKQVYGANELMQKLWENSFWECVWEFGNPVWILGTPFGVRERSFLNRRYYIDVWKRPVGSAVFKQSMQSFSLLFTCNRPKSCVTMHAYGSLSLRVECTLRRNLLLKLVLRNVLLCSFVGRAGGPSSGDIVLQKRGLSHHSLLGKSWAWSLNSPIRLHSKIPARA